MIELSNQTNLHEKLGISFMKLDKVLNNSDVEAALASITTSVKLEKFFEFVFQKYGKTLSPPS